MLLGVGIDVLNQQRIAALLARRGSQKLVTRILSSTEALDWNNLTPTRQVQFLAVRWSVKEAAYKAMYPVLKPTWKELTYRGLQSKAKPSLDYHPALLDDKEKVGKIHVSVSHDGHLVFATVIIENPAPKN